MCCTVRGRSKGIYKRLSYGLSHRDLHLEGPPLFNDTRLYSVLKRLAVWGVPVWSNTISGPTHTPWFTYHGKPT